MSLQFLYLRYTGTGIRLRLRFFFLRTKSTKTCCLHAPAFSWCFPLVPRMQNYRLHRHLRWYVLTAMLQCSTVSAPHTILPCHPLSQCFDGCGSFVLLDSFLDTLVRYRSSLPGRPCSATGYTRSEVREVLFHGSIL